MKISNNCIIGGGTTIGSNVKINDNVFVGVGAVFAAKKITIGNSSFICSGSAVFQNIKANPKLLEIQLD